MYNEQIETLISAALADGALTEKERQVLFKKAQSMGIDIDEFEMVLDARIVELKKKEKSQRSQKSNKHGDFRKCPNCGANVPALATICPECKMEFLGIAANSSAQKLAQQIDSIIRDTQKQKSEYQASASISTRLMDEFITGGPEFDADDRIEEAIKNFPIPNTKSDLFEFIVSLQSKIKEENISSYKISAIYKSKLDECIEKAQILFPQDQQLINLCNKVKSKEPDAIKKLWKSISGIVYVMAVIILLMLLDDIVDIFKALLDKLVNLIG